MNGFPIGPVGQCCTSWAQCSGITCEAQNGALFSGGYCTSDCGSSACPSGSSCSSFFVAGQTVCVQNCSGFGQSTCRPNYVCEHHIINGNDLQGGCYPACGSVADCPGSGLQCVGGYCCGTPGFRCCNGTSCTSGTCKSDGYCG
jgi:serine protease